MAFAPTDLTGLIGWYDASDAATVTGVSPVTQWADKSGSGNHMSHASLGPAFNAANQAMEFRGTAASAASGQSLDIPAGMSVRSAYLMLRWCPQPSATNRYQGVLGHSANTQGITIDQPTTTSSWGPRSKLGPNNHAVNGQAWVTQSSAGSTTPIAFADTGVLVEWELAEAHNLCTWFGAVGSARGFNPKFDVHEFLIFDRVLTADEKAKIEGYLTHKYGRADLLPSGHTYKASPPGGLDVVSGSRATVGSLPVVTSGGSAIVMSGSRQTAGSAPSVAQSIVMTQLPANRIFQRASKAGGLFGKGAGTVPVQVTLASAVSSVKYRLRDAVAGGNPVLQGWTAASGALAAGTHTIACPDVPARAGWYYLDLMVDDDPGRTALGTSPVAMGRIISLQGQSQAARQFVKMPTYAGTNASLGVTISPNCAIFARITESPFSVTAPVWELPSDGGSWGSVFASEFLRRQVDVSGVTCGLIGHSKGSTTTGDWLPGSALNNELRSVWDAVGGFETWMIHHGGSDASAGTTQAQFEANLDAIVADAAAHNAVLGSGFDKIVCTLATRLAGAGGTVANTQAIRRAGRHWASANSARYIEPHDVNLEDNVHQGQPGNIRLAHQFHRATRPGLGLSGSNDGPVITSAARASGSRDIVLSVALPSGATALVSVGDPSTRFKVYPSGALSGALALDAVTPISVGVDTITLRLAADPGAGAVDVHAFLHPDPSGTTADANIIYDNHVDGDGIANGRQLTPTIDAVATTVSSSANVTSSFRETLGTAPSATAMTPASVASGVHEIIGSLPMVVAGGAVSPLAGIRQTIGFAPVVSAWTPVSVVSGVRLFVGSSPVVVAGGAIVPVSGVRQTIANSPSAAARTPVAVGSGIRETISSPVFVTAGGNIIPLSGWRNTIATVPDVSNMSPVPVVSGTLLRQGATVLVIFTTAGGIMAAQLSRRRRFEQQRPARIFRSTR